jgi:hypothetical protein
MSTHFTRLAIKCPRLAVAEPRSLAAMKRLVLASLILVGLLIGCGPRFGGGSFGGSYGNADLETTTEVVTQCDRSGQLLFVIAWTARSGGGTTTRSQRNLLTKIHGRPVQPSLDRRAVYAFQTDGSLQEISLTEEQVAALFREMQATDFHTSHNQLWQKEVVPKLIRVEASNSR